MKKIFIPIVLLLLAFACSKEEPKPNGNGDPGTVPLSDLEIETSGIVVNPEVKTVTSDEWTQNVSITDSANFNLQIDENTIKKYDLKEGSILVSDNGDGFLRKIKSIGTAANGKAAVETEFCSMEEVFKEGSISVKTKGQMPAPYLNAAPGENIYRISDSKTFPLNWNLPPYNVSGSYTAGTTIDFSVSFHDSQLQNVSFSIGFVNQLEINAAIEFSKSKKICLYVQRLPRIVIPTSGPPIIIVPVLAIYLQGEAAGQFDPCEARYTSNLNATATISYDGQLHSSSTCDFSKTFESSKLSLKNMGIVTVKVSVVGEVQFKIYGVLSPYFTVSGYGKLEGGFMRNPGWIGYVGWGIDGGIKASIFSKKLFDLSANLYDKPPIPVAYSKNDISIVSGNGQKSSAGKPLPQPLVVKVTNCFDYPLQGYRVKFESTAGGGKLSQTDVTTDVDGQASTGLTLNNSPNYSITASAVEINDTPHKGEALYKSPVEFTATLWDGVMSETIWNFDLKSTQQNGSTEMFSCNLKAGGIVDVNGRQGTWSLSGNSLIINWVQIPVRPFGCTYKLTGTVNGATCSGTYTHTDYDAQGKSSLYDSGTFTGYLSTSSTGGF